MARFKLRFHGKKIGALGISYAHEIEVEADDHAQARMKAYDTHEHISGGADGVSATRLIDEELYVSYVSHDLNPHGLSHRITAIGDRAKPIVACGADTGPMNWTGNPKPRTPVCPRCAKAMEGR